MLHFINNNNIKHYKNVVDIMFMDRKHVFIDLLKWEIPADGTFERDQFDDDNADYLIVSDPSGGDHLGSVRLLRTDRPHIIGNIFPHLCDMPVPTGTSIREITRLCLSPRLRAPERRIVRNRLATGLTEHALLTGISSYTGVAEMGWLTQILGLGWRCVPLGIPKAVGKSLLGGLQIHIGTDTMELLRDAGTYSASGLTYAQSKLAA
ncbi:acyl-homoserine-lactone synthase [Novosphingobium sp. Chol11]|uniref:acyl-homoserine-lactone synthase n=1 Tax=Novosphingobium sp. Chol11 TaxID=1385763 RepID=UPI000BE26D45|nr:acyl-homoserine-lactone synthase [Novosphingobium sp. Chol11]